MRRLRARDCVALVALAIAARAAPGRAQAEAAVDATVSVVKYDGFLSSGAAAVTPSVTWRSPQWTLAARGTFLAFESGNGSAQGLLSAAAFSAPGGRVRLEAAGEAGASTYAGFAQYAHALGRVRAHVLGDHWGAWAGPLGGVVAQTGTAGGATGLSAGWWGGAAAGALGVTWTRVSVTDTAFSDLRAWARWRAGAIGIEGTAGVRTTDRSGGSDLFGDLSATLRLAQWVDVLVGAGSYPRDPVSGTISGRYATAGVRLALRRPRPFTEGRTYGNPAPTVRVTPDGSAGAEVTVERSDASAILVVHARGASRVEVMGDFTDWQPVALVAAGTGRFRYATPLGPGMYRFNVRLDGGAWRVPEGAGAVADDFGGAVGVLVVP